MSHSIHRWLPLVLLLTLAAFAQDDSAVASKRRSMKQPRFSPTSISRARMRVLAERARQALAIPGERAAEEAHVIDPDYPDGIPGGQNEFSIAVDPTGRNIVVGFNSGPRDSNPQSTAGVAYSNDGGETFQDGGVLTAAQDGTDPDGNALPQICCDPSLNWVPGGNGCQFIYVSVMFVAFPATRPSTDTANTLALHRSSDCGKTWTGPFQIPASFNPHGASSAGSPGDSADKELIDVDRETGRVMVTWTNFTSDRSAPGGTEISASFSDDVMTGNPPTWSARALLSGNIRDGGGHGSVPRFGPKETNDVYVSWSCGSVLWNICFAVSHDKGANWQPGVTLLRNDFETIDEILGNDRVNQFPSMAVDLSNGPNRGAIYITYITNDNLDGGDVALLRSTDAGKTFSKPVLLNNRPGNDRAQWFPYVSADRDTGRVSVIFYDQSVAASGELTQMLMTFSDDGGQTWSAPAPLSKRPFHAGYGNDTGEPNLGDYIGSVSEGGTLYAAWAGTPNSVSFTDGQPNIPMTIPMLTFARFSGDAQPAVDLGTISVKGPSADGFLRPGDTADFTVALRNPVTTATPLKGVQATLSTQTAGVNIVAATASYPDLSPDSLATSVTPFTVALASGFLAGTPIEFVLDITTSAGTARRLFTQNTGAPQGTVIFSEDFESAQSGALPSGWQTAHGGGLTTVPWATSKTFCNTTSNGLFHINAEDGRRGNAARWERAISPTFAVPASAKYVTIDFDICYDTEDEPGLVTGYDGATLRITDQTRGRIVRSVFAEAFAEEIRTGNIFHFPKHLPSANDPDYLDAISVWGGDSGGMIHVSMRLPGMAGSSVQLRWEYTQDTNSTCQDVRSSSTACGVLVDNIVVRSITF